jgi:hypothetical protein
VYAGLAYTYALLWFTTPFFMSSIGFALIYIFATRSGRQSVTQPLPLYPPPEQRDDLFLVLGEQHHATRPGPSPTPCWLTIPERGLYTGTLIVGAIGSGKTSACMYPYACRLVERGVPITKVQDLLGHASVVTTERYVHHTLEELHKAAVVLESGGVFDAEAAPAVGVSNQSQQRLTDGVH